MRNSAFLFPIPHTYIHYTQNVSCISYSYGVKEPWCCSEESQFPILADGQLSCIGNEATFYDCIQDNNAWGITDCSHDEDLYVYCSCNYTYNIICVCVGGEGRGGWSVCECVIKDYIYNDILYKTIMYYGIIMQINVCIILQFTKIALIPTHVHGTLHALPPASMTDMNAIVLS